MLVLNNGKNRRYSAMQFNDTYNKQGISPISFQAIKDDIYDKSVDNCPQGHELKMINGIPKCVPMKILERTSVNYSGFGLHIITDDKPYDRQV